MSRNQPVFLGIRFVLYSCICRWMELSWSEVRKSGRIVMRMFCFKVQTRITSLDNSTDLRF